MRTRKEVRHNPHSVHSKLNEEPILVSLVPHFEEIAEGEGLHCKSPETYLIWIETVQAEALEIGEIYWDEILSP
jgi:hypothetical protein